MRPAARVGATLLRSRPVDLALRAAPWLIWPLVVRELGAAAALAALVEPASPAAAHGLVHLLTALLLSELGHAGRGAGRLAQLALVAAGVALAIARDGDALTPLYTLAAATGVLGAEGLGRATGLGVVANVAVAALALQGAAGAGLEAFAWAWLALAAVVALADRAIAAAAPAGGGRRQGQRPRRPRPALAARLVACLGLLALPAAIATPATAALLVATSATALCDGLADVIGRGRSRAIAGEEARSSSASLHLALRLPIAFALAAVMPRALAGLGGAALVGSALDGVTAAAAALALVAAPTPLARVGGPADRAGRVVSVALALALALALGLAAWLLAPAPIAAAPLLALAALAGAPALIGAFRRRELAFRRVLPALAPTALFAAVVQARRAPTTAGEVGLEAGAVVIVAVIAAVATWHLSARDDDT